MGDVGQEAGDSGAEIMGSDVISREEKDRSMSTGSAGRALAFLRAWSKQRRGWRSESGVRQRRPSAKVKVHKDARSCGRIEDMGCLLRLNFGLLMERAGLKPGAYNFDSSKSTGRSALRCSGQACAI